MEKNLSGKLGFIPLVKCVTPKDGEVYSDRWWVCHPVYGAAFYRPRGFRGWIPQCSRDERMIDDMLLNNLYSDTRLVKHHIPTAYFGSQWDDEWGHRPDVSTIKTMDDLIKECK